MSRKLLILIAVFIVTVLYDSNFASCQTFPIAIQITEPSAIDRKDEFVTVGIPFSRKDALLSTSKLALYRNGVPVEAQFSVTGRWDGAPGDDSKMIKWVLVDFKVDSIGASQTLNYNLNNDGKGTPVAGIMISDVSGQMIVDTGAAQFYLSKTSFDFLSRVIVQGKEVVSPNDTSGSTIIDSSTGTSSALGGKSDTANRGTYTSRNAEILEFYVEPVESGTIHSIITVRGLGWTATGARHLEWLYRMHFYKNSSQVKVSYTITDRYLPSNLDRYDIDYVGIRTRINSGGSATATFGGDINSSNVYAATLGPGTSVSLRQTGVVEQSLTAYNPGTLAGLTYVISGAIQGSGNRSRGWANLSDGNVGVTGAIRRFWKMYPKQIDMDGSGNFAFALWPQADVDMTLYGGAQRTHDLLYDFYVGTKSVSEMEAINGQFQSPLIGFISPDYISWTNALGAFSSFDRNRFPTDFWALIDALNVKVNGLADWITSSREYDTNEPGKHSYGFWATGDNHRGDSFWAANDYDLLRAYVMAALSREQSNYRYKWWNIASETASNVYDVQIQHNYVHNRNDISSDLKPVVRNGNTREKKYVGRSAYNPCSVFHDMGSNSRLNINIEHQTGALGLSYYYFLTGDLMAKDIAISQRYYLRTFREFWNAGDSNARSYGQFIQIWSGIYSLTGDLNDLDDLNYWITYANKVQDSQTTVFDPNGEIWNGGSPDTTVSFMNSLMFIAYADLYNTYPQRREEIKLRINKASRFTQDQSKHLWDDAKEWFWRDPYTTTEYGFHFSASPGFAFSSLHDDSPDMRDRYFRIMLKAYNQGLYNTPISKEKDASSLLRGLFTGLAYLQLPHPVAYK